MKVDRRAGIIGGGGKVDRRAGIIGGGGGREKSRNCRGRGR